MFDFDDDDNNPEAILEKLNAVIGVLSEHAEDILKQYNLLRNNDYDDSVRTQICRKIFEESEKEGTHRKLLFGFYKAATELTQLSKETSSDDEHAMLKLMVLTIAGMQKFHKLQASAEEHMKLLKTALKAVGERL